MYLTRARCAYGFRPRRADCAVEAGGDELGDGTSSVPVDADMCAGSSDNPGSAAEVERVLVAVHNSSAFMGVRSWPRSKFSIAGVSKAKNVFH